MVGNHFRGSPIVCNPEVELTAKPFLMKPRLVLKVICLQSEEDEEQGVTRSVFINVGTCEAIPLRRSKLVAEGKEPLSAGGRSSCISVEEGSSGHSPSNTLIANSIIQQQQQQQQQQEHPRGSRSSNASISGVSISSRGTLGCSVRKRTKSVTADVDFICMVGGRKKPSKEPHISVYDVAVNPASIPVGQMENFTAKAEEVGVSNSSIA